MPEHPNNPLLQSPTRPLPRHVAIIGAGSIGPDIGYYLKSALPALQLTLIDINQGAIDAALKRFADYAKKALAKGKMNEAQAAAVQQGVQGSTDYDALKDCDWVIEAATENLALKRRIFAQVEARVAMDAVITSNTSSLPAARIFAELKNPERATVTHFFAPAWRNPAVEVIDWPHAAPELVAWLRWVFCSTGKVPLLTRDVPCFMLDRIFDNWCNEAALLLDRATAAQIDTVAAEFVHAGPFFVLNLARGNPIITETNTLQADEEGEHYRPATIFQSVDHWLTVAPGQRVDVSTDTARAVRERLLGSLLSQSVDILDRGIGTPADLDLGCVTALGFKAGPLALLRDMPHADAQHILKRLALERPGMPMPKRTLADYLDFERHVLVDDVQGVKVITLRRPEALNALHDEMTDEILAVIRRFENDPAVTGFVIIGYGTKAFCAGADIGRFADLLGDKTAAAQYARDCSRLLVHLDAMHKPVVAALNGMALGGGFELAMRCHALVAMEQAWMQLPEVSLGLLPGIGAMVVPYRRWPQAAGTFHGMLRRCDKLKASQALALGMVDALASSPAELISLAVARVQALAKGRTRIPDGPVALPAFDLMSPTAANGLALSPTTLGLIERAVLEAAQAPTLSAALEIGYLAFGDSACTAAAREGIAAFGEKRAPDFARVG
ncbi:3-hydroxyacyl-CoA dehydrogenase NAD-binding domain-containing protein [Rhodoferax sp.]|uniref:3-hydroxyacyl-CoA dehydrogenase/enoyl-CoA hydratase family protein n=1 Tax=Rhodoferax sp. TaxID=50421 RepID=UPI0027502DFD|nr:3-hydroxyacyl-CoA dehydrogenase NAD-binding domain-containing protein [Rhodoferax sp.]